MFKKFITEARMLLKKHHDQLPGGKADKMNPKDFDKKELAMGIKHEMEHTDDPNKAREIAMDHLSENPKYYSELKKAKVD